MLETFESSRHASRSPEFRGAGKPQDVSMLDVSGMVSRTLGLPADSAEVTRFAGELHGTINNDPVLRHAVLTGGGIQSFILGRVPPDIAEKLDPARRAEADRQRQMQTANRSGSEYAAAFGQLGGGIGGFTQGREARGGIGGGDGNRALADTAGRTPGRNDYGGISLANPQSVTLGGFASTPYAREGKMDFNTFNYVRNYDKSFSGRNIVDAAKEADKQGFSTHDPEAIAHQALIEQNDPHKEKTNQHFRAFNTGLDGSDEFRDAAQAHAAAKTPQERAAAEQRMQAAVRKQSKESGVDEDENDASKPAKAHQGIVLHKQDSVKRAYRCHTGKNLELQQGMGDQPAKDSTPSRRSEAAPAPKAAIQTSDATEKAQGDDFLSAAGPADPKSPALPKAVASAEPAKSDKPKQDKPESGNTPAPVKSAAKMGPSPTAMG